MAREAPWHEELSPGSCRSGTAHTPRADFETGNPRIDLLRREVRGYYDDDVAALRRRFGRYILLNSNFGRVNTAVKRRRVDDFYAKDTGRPSIPPGGLP